jgi:hypothetical protein
MRTKQLQCVGLLVAGIAAMSPNVARGDPSDKAVVEQFERSVTDYMTVRERATAHLAPLESSYDMRTIQQAIEARGAAIAEARREMSGGEFFSPAVATVFRTRIQAALSERGLSAVAVLDDIEDEPSEDTPVLVVNGPFPWSWGTGNAACILEVLPRLPAVLEYRFVHTTLVLVDVEANLIVDTMPDAIVIPYFANGPRTHPGLPIVGSPEPASLDGVVW